MMSQYPARVCATCGALQSYPRPVCHVCESQSFSDFTPPMDATIYSMTTVWRAPDPVKAAEVPYTVALVQGPQGGLLMVRLRGFEELTPAIGETIRIDAEREEGKAGLAGYPNN
jgi:uncharacterized OB-fold protein